MQQVVLQGFSDNLGKWFLECENQTWNDISLRNFRKSLTPILWTPGMLETPHAHKIPRFRGGGGFFWREGSATFILWARGFFGEVQQYQTCNSRSDFQSDSRNWWEPSRIRNPKRGVCATRQEEKEGRFWRCLGQSSGPEKGGSFHWWNISRISRI